MAARTGSLTSAGLVQPYQIKPVPGSLRARSMNSKIPLRSIKWPTLITSFWPGRCCCLARQAVPRAGSGAKNSVSTPLERAYTGFFSPYPSRIRRE